MKPVISSVTCVEMVATSSMFFRNSFSKSYELFAALANAVAALIPIPPNTSKDVISPAKVLIIPIASRVPSYMPELSRPVAINKAPSLFLIPIMRLW